MPEEKLVWIKEASSEERTMTKQGSSRDNSEKMRRETSRENSMVIAEAKGSKQGKNIILRRNLKLKVGKN